MKKLSLTELNRISVDEFKKTEKVSLSIILDNIRSLNNIGSVFRTADAFLIEKIYLCGITATPPNREINKTALGATESVDWQYYKNTEDIVKKLKSEGYVIVSVEQTDKSILLNDFKPEKEKKYALILGNEVKGVEQKIIDLSDYAVEIPQYGTKHSINVSVANGIVVWDFFSKIKLKT
jgi:tRNA G18 (ribose-2'-O)-methylase SpoU